MRNCYECYELLPQQSSDEAAKLMGGLRQLLAKLHSRVKTLEIAVPKSRKKGLSYTCAKYPCRHYSLPSVPKKCENERESAKTVENQGKSARTIAVLFVARVFGQSPVGILW